MQSAGRTSASPQSPTKDPECLAGKLEWIHNHFPAWMHRQFAITPRKHLFARPDSLLIDDYGENVERFKAHGGHAITVPRPWNDHWAADPRKYLEENWRRHSRRARMIPVLKKYGHIFEHNAAGTPSRSFPPRLSFREGVSDGTT